MKICVGFLLFITALGPAVYGQAPKAVGGQSVAATGSRAALSRVIGDVVAKDASKITLKTADVAAVAVGLDSRTIYRRVPAGETTLEKAVSIQLDDVQVGDRVLARGTGSQDSLVARDIIVISRSDLSQKRALDRQQWQTRGLTGKVTAVNADKKEITILARSNEGERPVVIAVDGKVTFRRYAPDSVRYKDAKVGAFADLKVGDQLRVLGQKNADGTRFVPEEIVSGTFRAAAGRISSVDAQKGEVTITNIQTGDSVTVAINGDSIVRKFTPDLVKTLIARITGETAASGTDQSGAGAKPNLQETIVNLPAQTIADLKPGDAVMVSSTAGATPKRVTAIMLATGLEELLKRVQKAMASGASLNLELGLPGDVNP